MALTREQNLLMTGLTLLGVEKDAMIGIALMVKEPKQTEEMINFLADNQNATEEQILEKAAEIHNAT